MNQLGGGSSVPYERTRCAPVGSSSSARYRGTWPVWRTLHVGPKPIVPDGLALCSVPCARAPAHVVHAPDPAGSGARPPLKYPPPPLATHLTHRPPNCPRSARSYLGNLGEHGLTLSRSRQQGRSTAYRTRTHIKVVCRGFVPARPKLQSARRRRLTSEAAESQPDGAQGQKAYSRSSARAGASPRSGTDSDLEAFSHYPADGSFAALPGRTAAKTNYLNQRFLSY